MCGIAGFVDFNKASSRDTLVDMTDVLSHRGPDDSGYRFREYNYGQVALGHRRLSILDLSLKGHQPMTFEHLIIVYNGEVYNFKEIRCDLVERGYSFVSDCDTEVVLKAFHLWGPSCVDRFNGMLSFSILDEKKEELYFFRDRAGVKPLYWYYQDSLLLFASELKSFHKHPYFNSRKKIDKESLAVFFNYGFIRSPRSIFENTYKLSPGSFLRVKLATREIAEVCYWNVEDFYLKPKLVMDEVEVQEELEKLLISSFKYRTISDVPVGVLLSGGVDSSLVTAILQRHSSSKIKTFTIGFNDKKLDEAIYARKVAEYLRTDHVEYYATEREALDILPQLPDIYDEPIGDNSVVPTLLVSKVARQHVKVVLSADGGDELFGGYSGFSLAEQYLRNVNKAPYLVRRALHTALHTVNRLGVYPSGHLITSGRIAKVTSLLKSRTYHDVGLAVWTATPPLFIGELLKDSKEYLLRNDFYDRNQNYLSNSTDCMLIHSLKYNLADGLMTKVDRASMSVSLEGREPFLDYRLIEFAAQLEMRHKIIGNSTKTALKKLLCSYVPKELIEREKMGFTSPYGSWLKTELKDLVYSFLNEESLKNDDLFDAKSVIKIRDSFYKGQCPHFLLWYILIFKMWHKRWMQ